MNQNKILYCELDQKMEVFMNFNSFILSSGVLLASLFCFHTDLMCSNHKKKCSKEVRDYIIVGGGTSGLVTGYLLDKDGKDVLVLEAGEDYDNNPEIVNAKPIGALETGFLNYFFWNTQNQPNANMPNDTDRHMTGGRAIGGTSTVNDQIYWRGSLSEYALWGGLFADSNYVQNTFAAVETYSGTTQNPAARGNSGPFAIRQSTLVPIGTKMAAALQNTLAKPAFGSRAIPLVPDFNTVDGPAISEQAQLWIKELTPTSGERHSTSIVLLGNKKSKVEVRDSAMVLRILFNKRKNKAVAVEYLHKNKVKRVWARKKIILAAGARSCAVLMKSGYGPEQLLKDNNIKVVFNNPNVGLRLKNHLFVTPQFSCPVSDNELVARPQGTPLNKDLAFMASVPAPSGPANGQSLEYTVINAAPGVGVMAIILNEPQSSGTVRVYTDDPLHELIVDLPGLSSPEDMQKMVEAVQIYQDMITSTPGYNFITPIPTDVAGIRNYIKTNARSIHHYTGTCSIGYVVDEHLKVIGVKNLLVADASIQQPGIRGHTYASSVLIGAVAYSEITGNLEVDFN